MSIVAPGPAPVARGRVRMARPARRAQLLDAAHEVFVAEGYHSAAMDDIAERAGVSKPVLYQHFPGKLELYLALLDRNADAFLATVRAGLATTTDNRQRVVATVTAYLDFVDGDGAHRMLFESDLRGEPQVAERVERMMREAVEALADTIAADSDVEPAEARLLSVGLAGMAEVAARWWLAEGGGQGAGSGPRGDGVDKDRAVELLSQLAWRGISGSPRRG